MAIKAPLSKPRRVVVIEENPNTRIYFKEILQSSDDFKFAGEFSNIDEALNKISALRISLVLLGVPTPNFTAIECIKRLKGLAIDPKIIIITEMADTDWVESSVAAGVEAFLFRPVSAGQCLVTLRTAVRNQIEIERKLQKPAPGSARATLAEGYIFLSRREQDVMSGLTGGLLYKEIADKLGISYSAVHKFQHRLFQKLHVTNRSEAIGAWQRAPSQ